MASYNKVTVDGQPDAKRGSLTRRKARAANPAFASTAVDDESGDKGKSYLPLTLRYGASAETAGQ